MKMSDYTLYKLHRKCNNKTTALILYGNCTFNIKACNLFCILLNVSSTLLIIIIEKLFSFYTKVERKIGTKIE